MHSQDKVINSITEKFATNLQDILHQSFNKIRQKSKTKESEVDQLLKERRLLKNRSDPVSKQNLAKIEDKLAEKCAVRNLNIIKNEINE